MIPLNQLIPECLLALGGAFLLGNLAAYIRLRPAWRDAKEGGGARGARKGRGSPAANRDAKAAEGHAGRAGTPGSGGPAANRDAEAAEGRAGPAGNRGRGGSAAARRSGGAKAAEGPRGGSAGRVSARVREPTPSGAKLPSRTRVLTNVLIGLLISLAALATLIRG